MVSDERRLQLNRNFFAQQVHRQHNAYSSPQPQPWEKLWRARQASVVESLRSLLPTGGKVLDVGCGTGQTAMALAQAGFEVTAVELIEAMLERAREVAPQVRWLHAPFSDRVAERGSFDAVVSLGFLEFQERAGKELVRMGRLLKPGGFLLLSVPNTLSGQFAFGAQRAFFRLGKEPEQVPVRHSFTPERLQRLLGMAGYILMDYQWMSAESAPVALGRARQRPFWGHRVRDRLKPEMLTLSRTYTRSDTSLPKSTP